jgi:hypothetical protein
MTDFELDFRLSPLMDRLRMDREAFARCAASDLLRGRTATALHFARKYDLYSEVVYLAMGMPLGGISR